VTQEIIRMSATMPGGIEEEFSAGSSLNFFKEKHQWKPERQTSN
jgi:hypothetical protein